MIEILIHPSVLSALCAILGAIVGAYFGNLMALSERRKRIKNLYKAFYSEINTLNDYLKGWMVNLFDEFEKPSRMKISEYLEYDIGLTNNLLMEMAVLGCGLSKSQRKLINNIRSKIESIKYQSEKRLSESEVNDRVYYIEKESTAYLIRHVGELIYYINKFDKERNEFEFDLKNQTAEHVKKGVELSGVIREDAVMKDLIHFSGLS